MAKRHGDKNRRMFSGKWFFRHRGVIAHTPLLLVLFWRRGEVNNPALMWGAGLALLFAGMALRIWAQSYIHHRLKLPLELTTGGPYQLVRNPLYIGNAAVCASATFFARLPWLAPFILLWVFTVYSIVVHYEEGWLRELYGGPYERYLREVPRWFPRLGGLRPIVFWNEFSPKAVRAELHCLLIALIFGLKGLADSPAWHLALTGIRARLFS
jgi:protein-S-isoprenylcysteine O-methyltransferase Ste14